MGDRVKWVVVGGAAAFVVTPVAVYAGTTVAESDLGGTGIVVSGTMRHLDEQQRAQERAKAAARAEAEAKAEAKAGAKKPESTSPKSPRDAKDDDGESGTKSGTSKGSIESPQTPTRVEVPTPVSPRTPDDDSSQGGGGQYSDDDDDRYEDRSDDRDDDSDYMGSENLVSFAEEQDWFDAEGEQSIDLQQVYGTPFPGRPVPVGGVADLEVGNVGAHFFDDARAFVAADNG